MVLVDGELRLHFVRVTVERSIEQSRRLRRLFLSWRTAKEVLPRRSSSDGEFGARSAGGCLRSSSAQRVEVASGLRICLDRVGRSNDLPGFRLQSKERLTDMSSFASAYIGVHSSPDVDGLAARVRWQSHRADRSKRSGVPCDGAFGIDAEVGSAHLPVCNQILRVGINLDAPVRLVLCGGRVDLALSAPGSVRSGRMGGCPVRMRRA